jgi:chitodextrinase
MKSYADNNMLAHVGYEIGIPAYPASDHDPTHQLPLTQSELTSILNVQGTKGGFFWELYKSAGTSANVDVTSAAQQICKAALGATTPRCSGVIPQPGGVVPTSTVTVTVTATTSVPTSTSSAPVTTTTSQPSACSADAWNAATAYSGGAKVSYNGRIYTALWWSQNNIPTDGNPWSDNGPCTTGTANPTPTATANPGTCSGVSAYSSTASYTGGAKVTYGGFVYTAQWWTQGETPGSAAVWVKGSSCQATLRRRRLYQ